MAELMRRALELEREAAYGLLQEFQAEPTRSVLFRSAAALALECGETEEARRLAFQGLAGSPPKEIVDELHDIVEEEQFRRHLATRGLALQPHEVQMSLAEPAIAAGIAPSSVIIPRLEGLQILAFRTAERQAGVEYRTRGRRQQKIEQDYEMFVGEPRAGSFAISICIGESKQMSLPGMVKTESVVREVFECFDLLASAGEMDSLNTLALLPMARPPPTASTTSSASGRPTPSSSSSPPASAWPTSPSPTRDPSQAASLPPPQGTSSGASSPTSGSATA